MPPITKETLQNTTSITKGIPAIVSPGTPAPSYVLSEYDLKTRHNQHTSNSQDVGDFEYFPFLSFEIRTMIWKHAMPRPEVITLTWNIEVCKSTAVSEKHGCHKGHTLEFLTFAAQENQFGVMMACKESRSIGLRALPKALPTSYSQPAGIRYNPEKTAIRLVNFDKIIEVAAYTEKERTWFCPKSHRGQGITTLVVPARYLWLTQPSGHDKEQWGVADNNWQMILLHMFKDVNTMIAEIDPMNPGYTFFGVNDEDEAESENQEAEEDEEPRDDNNPRGAENPIEEQSNEKNQKSRTEAVTAQPRRFTVKGGLAGCKEYVDLDKLENMMNDFWLNTLESMAHYGWVAENNNNCVGPSLSMVEGLYGNGAVLRTLPPRSSQSRFDFDSLYPC